MMERADGKFLFTLAELRDLFKRSDATWVLRLSPYPGEYERALEVSTHHVGSDLHDKSGDMLTLRESRDCRNVREITLPVEFIFDSFVKFQWLVEREHARGSKA